MRVIGYVIPYYDSLGMHEVVGGGGRRSPEGAEDAAMRAVGGRLGRR